MVKKLKLIAIFALSYPLTASAETCLFDYEQISGKNKICFYECYLGTRATTINATAVCQMEVSNKNPESRSTNDVRESGHKVKTKQTRSGVDAQRIIKEKKEMDKRKQTCIRVGYVDGTNGMDECLLRIELQQILNSQKQPSRNYQQPTQQNSQSDYFNRAMEAGAEVFNRPGSFGNPKPTKICNFKSREGAIISGDCEEWRITINGVDYDKLDR